jgi:cell wall assembly regulator SMI1
VKKIVVAGVLFAGFCMPHFALAQDSNSGCTQADLERLERSRMPADVREMMDEHDARMKRIKEDHVVVVEDLPDLPKARDQSK